MRYYNILYYNMYPVGLGNIRILIDCTKTISRTLIGIHEACNIYLVTFLDWTPIFGLVSGVVRIDKHASYRPIEKIHWVFKFD